MLTLNQIVGQTEAIAKINRFLSAPKSAGFVFAGHTGTGKTATASAIAHALGVDVINAEFGGLHTIAAGPDWSAGISGGLS